MLKTNSKQFIKNLHAYIMDNWNINDGDELRSWEETKESIIEAFNIEAYNSEWQRHQNKRMMFVKWLQGIPHNLGAFTLCQGVQDLGDLLEQTEEERNRYTETEAQDKLAELIYREITK